jgi:2-dehydro-3-deoxyphosphogluconate aldolase / (4S)-4-hydroxy-2-oxoglutarate aldolase
VLRSKDIWFLDLQGLHKMTITNPLHRMSRCGVIPVVTISDPGKAVALANALLAGGIDVIEVTLRTAEGLASLKRIARDCPDVLAVAGTVLTADQAREVADAGAQVVVSPGYTEDVDAAMRGTGLPWLPGVATASDCMRAVAAGRTICKFFPAEQAGGTAMIKALSGPFPQMSFCPTGGISLKTLGNYLGLQNVICVGGSWLVPADAMVTNDFVAITQLAAASRVAVDGIRAAN